MTTAPEAGQYDSPWKEALEEAFPEFIAFYFSDAYRQIDWTHEHVFLDQELRQIVRDAELGRRFVDKLARVTRLHGGEGWVYVHVEVQGSRDADFAKRMFVYNYRLFDRYDRPVASLAVLADEDAGWKPDRFRTEVFGCAIGIRFPVAKLTDHADRLDALLADANPFALVTAAHLLTRQTRQDPATRFQAKRRLVRLLYERDWNKRRILRLFSVLDWMMQLPKDLEAKLWQDIEDIEGERKVRYVTSVERLATERGMQQGIVKGEGTILRRQLTRRFGRLPQPVLDRLDHADAHQLETWADRVIDAKNLDEVFTED